MTLSLLFRKEPDLPFGFWFLGQQKHGLQKRHLYNRVLYPKPEEKEFLQFGIIKPVEAEGIIEKVLKYSPSYSSSIFFISCKRTMLQKDCTLV